MVAATTRSGHPVPVPNTPSAASNTARFPSTSLRVQIHAERIFESPILWNHKMPNDMALAVSAAEPTTPIVTALGRPMHSVPDDGREGAGGRAAEVRARGETAARQGAGSRCARRLQGPHRRLRQRPGGLRPAAAQRQLDHHLASYPVRGAGIAKLSSADIAGLASYGIATAFDAKRRDVRQIHGIGPVKAGNIAAWVSRLEARFQFQSAYSDDDQRLIRQARSDIIQKQQGAEERIKTLIEELRAEARAFERWRQSQDPELACRCRDLAQAEANLRYANLPVPGKLSFQPASRERIA
jgi:hypothetical protein